MDLDRGFRLDDWEVFPLQGIIQQGGHRVHVEPKVMDVLLCLARHPGEVVTRDRLLAEVWNGVVVTDDVVTRCISELRTVLRDTGRDRRFIRTVPKRGYGLLMPVAPLEAAAPPAQAAGSTPPPPATVPADERRAGDASAPSPWAPDQLLDTGLAVGRRTVQTVRRIVRSALIGLGVLIGLVVLLAWLTGDDRGISIEVSDDEAALPASPPPPGTASPTTGADRSTPPARIRSLAVLPLVNLSGRPEDEYFSDGLAEDLRNALIGVSNLRVAASTSSTAFRNKPMDVREIGRQLNVEALVEGTVRIEGPRLRVTTQLTDVRTGYPVWAASFERPVSDKLSLQAEVAAAILQQLAPSLAATERSLKAATGNAEAHEAYLLGRYYWNQRTPESIERSLTYFQQAVGRDPGYALAWSGLADAWVLCANYGLRPRSEALPLALQNARKALALDPGLAEAHASLGIALREGGDLAGARDAFQRAVDLKPGYSMAQMWLGTLLLAAGDATAAGRHLEAAQQLDPLHPAVQVNYISSLLTRGQLERARSEAERLLTLAPSEQMQNIAWHVALERGRYDEVLASAAEQAPAKALRPIMSDAVAESLVYLQRFDDAARLIATRREGLEPKVRLSLESGLAVARRDAPALRRLATELGTPAVLDSIDLPYRVCIRQWSTLWQGIADFMEGDWPAAAGRFQSVQGDTTPTLCEEDTPAIRAIALAYGVETAARQGSGDLAALAADARREIAGLRARGWNDATLSHAELAICMAAGNERCAGEQLAALGRAGTQPYGRLRSSPLFDRLWALPPLRQARPGLEAPFEATRKRVAELQLAKLGIP